MFNMMRRLAGFLQRYIQIIEDSTISWTRVEIRNIIFPFRRKQAMDSPKWTINSITIMPHGYRYKNECWIHLNKTYTTTDMNDRPCTSSQLILLFLADWIGHIENTGANQRELFIVTYSASYGGYENKDRNTYFSCNLLPSLPFSLI